MILQENKRTKFKPFRSNPAAGVSLIGLLVLIGVIGMMALGFMKNQSFNIEMQNLIRSKRSSQDSKQAFEAALMSAVRTDSCMDPATVFVGTSLAGTGTFSYTTNIIPGITVSQIHPPGLRTRISGAKNRCAAPTLGANKSYFCVQFAKNTLTPKGSFLSTGAAFAEVLVEHINFQNGQPVTCTGANTAPATNGARVIYSIYWLTKVGDGNNWQVLDGAINLAKQ